MADSAACVSNVCPDRFYSSSVPRWDGQVVADGILWVSAFSQNDIRRLADVRGGIRAEPVSRIHRPLAF
jgi:hypothetical protein